MFEWRIKLQYWHFKIRITLHFWCLNSNAADFIFCKWYGVWEYDGTEISVSRSSFSINTSVDLLTRFFNFRKIVFFMHEHLHCFYFFSDSMSDWSSFKSVKHLLLSVIVQWLTLISSPETITFFMVHHFVDDINLLCLCNSIKKLNKNKKCKKNWNGNL